MKLTLYKLIKVTPVLNTAGYPAGPQEYPDATKEFTVGEKVVMNIDEINGVKVSSNIWFFTWVHVRMRRNPKIMNK